MPEPEHQGKLISVQIGATATGMWALQSTDNIDGPPERRLWSLETATLLCNGATWSKIGGRTIPLSAKIAGDGSGNYTFGAGSTNLLALPVLRTDNSGGMHATAHALTCLRANVYTATGSVLNRVSTMASEIDLFLAKNSNPADPDTLVTLTSAPTVSGEALVQLAKTGTMPLLAGDFVSVKQYASVALTVDNRAGAPAYIATLELAERPSW